MIRVTDADSKRMVERDIAANDIRYFIWSYSGRI